MSKTSSTPPEPVEIKEAVRTLMGSMTGGEEDWGTLAVWYGNKIPQYLWTDQGWKRRLSKRGWKWQDFLNLLSRHTQDMIQWANNRMSWEKLVEAIENDLGRSITRLDEKQETSTIDRYSQT
jgi:hypothetical protein